MRKFNNGFMGSCSFGRRVFLVLGIFFVIFLTCGKVLRAECVSADIYHVHTGNETEGGKCYEIPVLCDGKLQIFVEPVCCGHHGKVINQREWLCEAGHIDKNSAGRGYDEFPHNARCDYVIGNRTFYQCEKCGHRFTEPAEVCGTLLKYEKNCGFEENERVAQVCLSADNSHLVQSVRLVAQIVGQKDSSCVEALSITWPSDIQGSVINGSEACVTANGEYCISVPAGENTSAASLSINISCIDIVSPEITAVYIPYAPDGTYAMFGVAAEDNRTDASHLKYVFSNGTSTVGDGRTRIFENGTYEVAVYDEAGNVVRKEVEVSGIVKPPLKEVSEGKTESPNEESGVSENVSEEKTDALEHKEPEEKQNETLEQENGRNGAEQKTTGQNKAEQKENGGKLLAPTISILRQQIDVMNQDDFESNEMPDGIAILTEEEMTVPEAPVLPLTATKAEGSLYEAAGMQTAASSKTASVTGNGNSIRYVSIVVIGSVMISGCYGLFTKGRLLLHNGKKSDNITMNIN